MVQMLQGTAFLLYSFRELGSRMVGGMRYHCIVRALPGGRGMLRTRRGMNELLVGVADTNPPLCVHKAPYLCTQIPRFVALWWLESILFCRGGATLRAARGLLFMSKRGYFFALRHGGLLV